MSTPPTYIAFDGDNLLIEGSAATVARAVRHRMQDSETHDIRIFNAATSHTAEFDMRGSEADMLARIEQAEQSPSPVPPKHAANTRTKRGPGRPKLGVTSKEVTLLPRHWDWLAAQPGGASVTLRKLVEEARRNQSPTSPRAAREILYRFMTRMAGDKENFEEASRALFAGDAKRFDELTERWPWDIYTHLQHLAENAFTN